MLFAPSGAKHYSVSIEKQSSPRPIIKKALLNRECLRFAALRGSEQLKTDSHHTYASGE
jgi:hypothetical protein